MRLPVVSACVLLVTSLLPRIDAQTEIAAARITPNLTAAIERPLRYRPDHGDFVIENGTESFNRSLYGGHTAFRVDGGDRPEFVLYLPGRGGNVRLGLRRRATARWLRDAASVETRYRPGELDYIVRDPLLGSGTLRVAVLAYGDTEGLIVRAEGEDIASAVELLCAYGGINGQRGKRDGDIGTENVPISEWFQLRPEFCRGNRFELGAAGFIAKAKAATIVGTTAPTMLWKIVDATCWNDPIALRRELDPDEWARAGNVPAAEPSGTPVVIGRVPLVSGSPVFVSLQRVDASASPADLDTYREVSTIAATDAGRERPALLPAFSAAELPRRFDSTRANFDALRGRVSVVTPDPFVDAAMGALNVAADALWDESQRAIMHGAIAWRTRLLGWRGPYVLDALGWHDRARENAVYWFGRQNTDAIPARVPPPDEAANLARNEAGLHTNGDLSRSHYDMNLVFIDAVFRHLAWTGDLAFAREAWPVIERHLAWERRLFRREFGSEKLPLYEAYAAIWASDDLQYSGGGTAHASAYNYFENRQAARLARLLGADATPYEHESELIARAMRELLWVNTGSGVAHFAECKDWLGLQRVHPDAALWTFYHTIDSQVPTPTEAWQMTMDIDRRIPRLPVRGPDVPAGLETLATSRWMPYDWSINNVVMAEAVHAALAYWQAGRPDRAWAITKGSVLAAMYMGISPGNVGTMSYLDVYRRESQRDFGDGAGVLSRALIEGLFGVRPDLLAGQVDVAPGWPAEWEHATLHHPDFDLSFRRTVSEDTYAFTSRFARPVALRFQLRARRDQIAGVSVNGRSAAWHAVEASVGWPRMEVVVDAAAVATATPIEVRIRWSGAPIETSARRDGRFVAMRQGQMAWVQPPAVSASAGDSPADAEPTGLTLISVSDGRPESVDLSRVFNDRVSQIFRHEYRAPRSPFVSLALPKQGLGGWAGGVNRTAIIDDSGLRALAAAQGGRLVLPNGVPFATPGEANAANVVFTSQWQSFPRAASVALTGRARALYLLVAGSTNPMQSRCENGAITVTYTDRTSVRLALVNPTNWWPIEQDYFIDDYQFRRPEPLPLRVDLKTGKVRELRFPAFKGAGGTVTGGAATVLVLPLDPAKELGGLTIEATANDVVVGLLAATLVR